MLPIAALACLTLASAQAPGAEPKRPNFLIVLMDDVGRDKMGFYGVGADPPKTPHLDGLAAKGIIFEHAWAAQACSPSRAALLTGRSADRTRIGAVIRPDDGRETPLALTEHLIPEDLPGYSTTHVGKWHLGDRQASIDHPRLSGFDHSIRWQGKNDYFHWTEYVDGEPTKKTGYFPDSMGRHVIRTITDAQAPFFIYYATKLGHTPYHDPPESHRSTKGSLGYARVQHRAMVEAIDTVLGDVLSAVDLSTTYVIVLGDNGSPGATVAPPFSLKKNKNSLFESGLSVPFVVAGPGVAQGQRCDELVCITDIFATIRELSGLGPPTRGAEDSISFARLLKDPSANGERLSLYVHRFPHKGAPGPNQRAVRTKRWKLIEDMRAHKTQLFDLDADPFEQENLAARAEGDSEESEALAKVMTELQARWPDLEPATTSGER